MLDKILMGWLKSFGLVCGWYAKRRTLVAGLLYPVLVAFATLWLASMVAAILVTFVGLLVCIPFRGLEGLGDEGKTFASMIDYLWNEMFGDDEEEPEEEPEETIEESVEVVNAEVDDLDGYLAESEES